jgi:hypothetical protein
MGWSLRFVIGVILAIWCLSLIDLAVADIFSRNLLRLGLPRRAALSPSLGSILLLRLRNLTSNVILSQSGLATAAVITLGLRASAVVTSLSGLAVAVVLRLVLLIAFSIYLICLAAAVVITICLRGSAVVTSLSGLAVAVVLRLVIIIALRRKLR